MKKPLNAEPVLLGQPRIPQEIQLASAFFQNRKNLRSEIEALEDALSCCAPEEKAALEETLAWMRSRLAETGPAYARAMGRAAPLIREGFEGVFQGLVRASE